MSDFRGLRGGGRDLGLGTNAAMDFYINYKIILCLLVSDGLDVRPWLVLAEHPDLPLRLPALGHEKAPVLGRGGEVVSGEAEEHGVGGGKVAPVIKRETAPGSTEC